jgi:long-chain acyl-CoA synthetase
MAATTLNLASILEHRARLTPDRIAVVCGPARLSFADLDRAACRLAAGLRALGLGPGDHIALSCPNTPHFPIAYFAILKVGAVVVPLNVLLKPREIAYQLADSDAAALIVFEGTAELPMARMARAACDEAPACRHLVVMTLDEAAPSPVERSLTMGQVMHGQPAVFGSHAPALDDTAVILYTSGTTGQPKGAELTHANMVVNAMAARDMILPLVGYSVDARLSTLVTLPLFHATGQSAQMNAGLAGGFTLVLLPKFDPAAVLRLFEEEAITYWVGVPTMYWTLLQAVRTGGLDPARVAKSLRVCASGGAPMPVQILRDFEATFGVRVLEGYGLSETSPVACFNQVFLPSKPGTVGLPLLGCEVAVVDDHDVRLGVGEPGEVVIRGHNVMKGYYKRPAETAEALRGGWLHTGDIGVIDADGFLAILDRKKDVILRGGMNVYPREIEDVLLTHPAVSLAAVVGVPDERLGEEVKAYVVVRQGAQVTEEALIAWSKEQMAAFKYPRSVEFRDALPVGATGKVLKKQLRH